MTRILALHNGLIVCRLAVNECNLVNVSCQTTICSWLTLSQVIRQPVQFCWLLHAYESGCVRLLSGSFTDLPTR